MISTDEYQKRIDIVFPPSLIYKKTTNNIFKEFEKLSTDLYRKFDVIKWNSYDLLWKYYNMLSVEEKKTYHFDNVVFQRKYILLGKLECFYEFICFIEEHFNSLFTLNIHRDNYKILNIKNSIWIKFNSFEFKIKNEPYFFLPVEKERIDYILKETSQVIQKIEKRLNENDFELFFLIFYKGSAQKINFYGIHPLIYEYLKPT